MKGSILTAIVLTTLSLSVVQADNLQPISPAPEPGSPGTATPTPYPQVVPPSIPKAGGTQGNSPLLPKIEMPRPPKDQPLPTVESGPADKDNVPK
ncbi:hypothetical protein AABC73_07670 [Pseudomonas sp. G.S.17]|uniref:hypothetical protein n=1 Tax=Pseudomonas TaxID=286 RepID=UPI0009B51CDB|nr:hypothetical protein [Pseudomonas syringae]